MTTVTREELINDIIEDDIKRMAIGARDINILLRKGHTGYDYMDDKSLISLALRSEIYGMMENEIIIR